MQLHEWQSALQNSILSETDLLGDFLKPGSNDRQIQLGIYTNAYTARLKEALRCNYPVIYQLLGDVDFDTMARGYLKQYPSEHASIRWFGAQLALFLTSNTPYNKLPILSELALFEWALRHTVDAADAKRVCVDDLLSILPQQWRELRFATHPSLSILKFDWNVLPVWKALSAGTNPPTPQHEPMHWLVYRQQDLKSVWRSANTIEVLVMAAILAQKTFADICELAAEELEDSDTVAATVAGALRGFVENGLLIAV